MPSLVDGICKPCMHVQYSVTDLQKNTLGPPQEATELNWTIRRWTLKKKKSTATNNNNKKKYINYLSNLFSPYKL